VIAKLVSKIEKFSKTFLIISELFAFLIVLPFSAVKTSAGSKSGVGLAIC